ncbi:MAG: hypothetical protein JJT78_03990 [Leptospira sp.]|nr:hypothetical protein [Leptospira sp.]
MGISFTKEEQVTDDILEQYIEGTLEVWKRPEVEKFIQKSKTVFLRYVEIKDMLFYKSVGKPMSKEMEAMLLDKLPTPNRILNHLVIRIRFLKDKIVVSSSDQEEMDYLGIMAEYAYRSSEPGSITIKRKINGEEVSIELIPGERPQEFFLGVESNPGKNMNCELYEKEKLLETLVDVSRLKIFEHPVASTNKTDLHFLQGGNVVFTISVFLMSER